METTVYNQSAKAVKKLSLPESMFGLPWNGDLVHQVTTALQANSRAGTAHTKDRSEVSGGGKKPWRQKGTGRSRHGSTRSPIWRHGGVTHGPRSEKDYSQKVNKKMRTKALFTALSEKARNNQIIFVDEITFSELKTKNAIATIQALASVKGFENLAIKKRNVALITLPGRDSVVEKSFANIPGISLEQVKDLNVLDVLTSRYLVMVAPENAIAFFESKKQ